MRYLPFLLAVTTPALAMGAEPVETADDLIVTASPLGLSADDLAQPVTVLEGDALKQKAKPTLGDTLNNELGIRSSYFGPNASRPVIRALDGDNITVLQNGLANLDASQTSVDHDVSVEPFAAERIEVIRGPAALLYGPRAVGGVVNVIDDRIPDHRIPEKASGTIDGRLNSANEERTGNVAVEGGSGNIAYHVDGFRRVTEDLHIPGDARSDALKAAEPLGPGEQEAHGRLPNSASDSKGGSFGLSDVFDGGYVGAAVTHFDTDYGTVAEPDVTIGLKQNRLDTAGRFDAPFAGLTSIDYKAGFSDYQHTEFEDGEAGTTFKNRGYDSRIEAKHRPIGGLLKGAFGFQSTESDFSALGEEAFLPPTSTYTNSAFVFEELPVGRVSLQLGGRADYQYLTSKDNADFGPGDQRNDLTGSASAGMVYRPIDAYAIALNATYTERAPNAQELFANGPHLATDAFEIGDRHLDNQSSHGLDLSFRKEKGDVTGEVNLFYTRFRNFIVATPTGVTNAAFDVPVFAYQNLPADFFGAEAKTELPVYAQGAQKVSMQLRGDYTQAENRDTHDPLPRIPPLRLGASALYHWLAFGAHLDADYNFDQHRHDENELPTKDYLELAAGADYAIDGVAVPTTLYLEGTNLLNQDERDHVSFLKDIAPLPGRSVMVGLRSFF